ncbi:CRISPR type III-B/RAMP module RAMP protein Cmr6 [Natranaerovirga hydrolytica]|uniref:CRISPR type III-B/RAMP module RAMP protein Cmr6 n=1 Tax=Natranaerovirga hydrolytica TaxID=680378 RepID=A0A4R1MZQ7_9FIRM|nr:type III-B CRISPR module RAMP protein Cmr6 [Natranaerovirga hydrolytica]TCK98675.1 CRISPR type III-B/RAMP module RAMP protein Cmr6 [Natranaerovirga hydrolytica]
MRYSKGLIGELKKRTNNQGNIIKLLRDIPMLIRYNGLDLTLDYITKKTKKEDTKEARKNDTLKSNEYMYIQRKAYLDSIIIHNYTKLMGKDDMFVLSCITNQEEINIDAKEIKNISTDNFWLKMNRYTQVKSKETSEDINNSFFVNINEKMKGIIDKYNKTYNYNHLELQVETDSKLIIGISEPSVKETSIKLDFIMGVPIIPASTLKGAFRNYLENSKKDNGNLHNWFGTDEKKGKLVFWDAYPVDCKNSSSIIETDVITPHSESCEGGSKKVPIQFPVVKKGTKFEIHISYSNGVEKEKVEEYVNEFIEYGSIGAKETVGYGVLKRGLE